MGRTAEFVFGLIGGIFGFFGAGFALFFGTLGEAFEAEGASTISTLGLWAVVFSIVAIVGAALVFKYPKIAGALMLIAAVGGLISISFAYLLSFVLLVIAGLMALIKKSE